MLSFIRDFVENWGAFIMSIISVGIAGASFILSAKNHTMQKKLSDLEIKIKAFEVSEINKNQQSKINADVYRKEAGKFTLRIQNSGPISVYNLSARIDDEMKIYMINEEHVFPFEKLGPEEYIDINLSVSNQSKLKFPVNIRWRRVDGTEEKTEQFLLLP